jgi:hypothetical protein
MYLNILLTDMTLPGNKFKKKVWLMNQTFVIAVLNNVLNQFSFPMFIGHLPIGCVQISQ